MCITYGKRGEEGEGGIIDCRFARRAKKSMRLGTLFRGGEERGGGRERDVFLVLRSSSITPQMHYTSGAPVARRGCGPFSF